MSKGREIELKRLLVGEGAAERLLAALGGSAAVTKKQTNHFFDTADGSLNQAHYILRLRFEDGEPILTAKGPGSAVANSTSHKLEAEAAIEPETAQAILAERLDAQTALQAKITDATFDELWRGLLQARAGRALVVVGSFENERRVVPVVLPSGLALDVEVDRSRFPHGASDQEVEIELPSEEVAAEVEAWLEGVARDAGVGTAPSSPKIARFLAALSRD